MMIWNAVVLIWRARLDYHPVADSKSLNNIPPLFPLFSQQIKAPEHMERLDGRGVID